MGYTHYWRTRRDTPPELLAEAAQKMAAIVDQERHLLADGGGTPHTSPVVQHDAEGTVTLVVFNGIAEAAHETFIWPPDLSEPQEYLRPAFLEVDAEVFHFCKTAYKPYDAVVTACLLAADATLGEYIRVSSDGDSAAWANGMEVYEEALGESPVLPKEVQ